MINTGLIAANSDGLIGPSLFATSAFEEELILQIVHPRQLLYLTTSC